MKHFKFLAMMLVAATLAFTACSNDGGSGGGGSTPVTDTEAVAQAAADLTVDDITFAGPETSSTITSSFTLPLTGTEGTTIVWTSDNGAVVITGGAAAVTQPAGSNATVTLTATITKGTITEAKTILITILKAAVWTTVGTGGLSEKTARNPKIAIDSAGTPYVLYGDENSLNKATVMKYNGSTWENVGLAGFSAGAVGFITLQVKDSVPYVAFEDGSCSGRPTVMKYDGNWELVGIAGFTSADAVYISLQVDDDGTAYISFSDYNSVWKVKAMKYSGSSWENLGNQSSLTNWGWYTSLKRYNGVSYLAYLDNYNSGKATVMKY